MNAKATLYKVRDELGRRALPAIAERGASFIAEFAVPEGVALSRACAAGISDPELRRTVETILFAAASGAILGIAVGSLAGGIAAAQVGALVGVGVGLTAASIALAISSSRVTEPMLEA